MGRKCFINKSDRERKNTKQGNKQIIPHSKHPSPPHLLLLRLMAGTDINKELTITTEMSKKTRARGRKGARGIDSL